MSDNVPTVLARLDYIERSLFGSPLVVKAAQPPTREPEPHECIPAIVEPDVPGAALAAGKALAALIADEAKNLELLRRLEVMIGKVHENPSLLTDEIRQELQAGYKVIDARYDTSGTTPEMDELTRLGAGAGKPIGMLSGDLIPLSDGRLTAAWYGHVQGYLNRENDIQEAIDSETCELCRQNFMAMADADVARGLIRVIDGRYEWVGQ